MTHTNGMQTLGMQLVAEHLQGQQNINNVHIVANMAVVIKQALQGGSPWTEAVPLKRMLVYHGQVGHDRLLMFCWSRRCSATSCSCRGCCCTHT